VPLNYHKLLLRLHAENKQRISFNDVVDIAKQCNMPTAPGIIFLHAEVRDALLTLHRLGQLLWWGDSTTLNNTVVLDPQWLIGAFTAIIRDPSLHSMRWLDAELDRLVAAAAERQAEIDSTAIKLENNAGDGDVTASDLDLADAVQLLRNRCVLTETLFDTVWPVSPSNADTALPPGVDGTPRYTASEQKVHIALCIFSAAAEAGSNVAWQDAL
jgi:hypothetical protein